MRGLVCPCYCACIPCSIYARHRALHQPAVIADLQTLGTHVFNVCAVVICIQCNCDSRDQWLECARAAFASMDSAETGHITSSQLVSLLSPKLPAEEVEHAVEDALMEAGCGGASVMLLRLMWVYVYFIRCMPLHTSKQSQRAAHVYSTL